MVETGNPYRDNVSRLITWGHWFSFFNIINGMAPAQRQAITEKYIQALTASVDHRHDAH